MPRVSTPAHTGAALGPGRVVPSRAQKNVAQSKPGYFQARMNAARAGAAGTPARRAGSLATASTAGPGASTGSAAHGGHASTLATSGGTGSATKGRAASVLNTTTSANNPASTWQSTTSTPNHYTYGTGTWARPYRAYGYGSGYRNRYYGNRYGYGRSQGNSRAIVSRLRSVYQNLARIDHDYQGHRVRAMHQISMAIRQLSHQSMIYNGMGFAPGMNMGMGGGMGLGNGSGNGNGFGMRGRAMVGGGQGFRGEPLTQQQSDARMAQSLRTLQGIGMQLANQGYYTMGHGRALGHIHQAAQHLTVALSIR